MSLYLYVGLFNFTHVALTAGVKSSYTPFSYFTQIGYAVWCGSMRSVATYPSKHESLGLRTNDVRIHIKAWRLRCEHKEKETDHFGRAPGCLASHACVPGSHPVDTVWVFQRNILVSFLPM